MENVDIFEKGKVYEFKVKKIFTNSCELINEEFNKKAYLNNTSELNLYKGQLLKCRVYGFNYITPKVNIIDIEEKISYSEKLTIENIQNLIEITDKYILDSFIDIVVTDEKDNSFELQCNNWIKYLLDININLNDLKRDLLKILENSNLLEEYESKRRELYQYRISFIIEHFDYYIKAREIISSGSNDFINNLLDKLNISGFIYHPYENLGILAAIFSLNNDIMNEYISTLIDIIHKKEISFWKQEPFRSSLIKVFDIYVNYSDDTINNVKNNFDIIRNTLHCLYLQFCLLGDNSNDDIINPSINSAKICLISSYYSKVASISNILDLAFYNLFNSEYKNLTNNTNVDNIPYIISNTTGYNNIDSKYKYSKNNIDITISSDGVMIKPFTNKENTYKVFPKELNLWKNLQISVESNISIDITKTKKNDIAPYVQVWKEIEKEISTPQDVQYNNNNIPKINDLVYIYFESQDRDDPNKFYCYTEDGVNGFISMEDIVPYKLQTSLQPFLGEKSFEAEVIDKTDDGLLKFSMLKTTKELVNDIYNEDNLIVCSIGSTPNQHGFSTAISQDGISINITNAGDYRGYIGKGSIVLCRLVGEGYGSFHLDCKIEEILDESSKFDLNTAFSNLINYIYFDPIEYDEKEVSNEEEYILIDETYIKSLIQLVDRMAMIDKEYIKPYNYLAFARALCLSIGWESQAIYYRGRMDIIEMLHYFANNNTIEEEKLHKLKNVNEDLFNSNDILRERFKQLQIISYLGKSLNNGELYEISKNDKSLKELASLALSYNIVLDSKMNSIAKDIHNRIKSILNLKGFESALKGYGSGYESENEEYKTSIIFYANDKINTPNPSRQMEEILKVINSFMNTNGGNLYIGVNDSGLGVGVEEDLKNNLFNYDKDKYKKTIIDNVCQKWGNKYAPNIKVYFDEDNKDKDVLIVEVSPVAEGVKFDNDIFFIRADSTKRQLDEKDFISYNKKRKIKEILFD